MRNSIAPSLVVTSPSLRLECPRRTACFACSLFRVLGLKTIEIIREQAGWRVLVTVEMEIGDAWQELTVAVPMDRMNPAYKASLDQLIDESKALTRALVAESAEEVR